MITVLAVFGLIFIIMIVNHFIHDSRHNFTFPQPQKGPFYLPVDDIRKDGVYAIENTVKNTIDIVAFLDRKRFSWFTLPSPEKTYEGAYIFNRQIQEKMKDYTTLAYNEHISDSNGSVVGIFKNRGRDLISMKCKLKHNGDLQVFITVIDNRNQSVTTWYDYRFVKTMIFTESN